ncbi:MAG: helix-turn-helix domain-containing protein [Thermoleophilia bacterium]|nr:helix-turn-helix domain-containing protein [Thermoleophilia bacterium]
MPAPITEREREDLRRLHAAGRSRNEIARELGRSGSTVSKLAASEGLSFDRAASVAPALEARRADLAAVRLDLIHRLYARAAAQLDRVEATVYVRVDLTAAGVPVEVESDHPPAQDERHHAQAISAYLTSAQRLADIDAGKGTGEVRSMLVDLARGIRAVVQEGDTEQEG